MWRLFLQKASLVQSPDSDSLQLPRYIMRSQVYEMRGVRVAGVPRTLAPSFCLPEDGWRCPRCKGVVLHEDCCPACSLSRPRDLICDQLISQSEEFPIGASFKQLKLYYISALMENRKLALPLDISSLIADYCEDVVRIDFLDVQDSRQRWCSAFVREIRETSEAKYSLFVHFLGWSSKWDEWVDLRESHRFAALSSMSLRADQSWSVMRRNPLMREEKISKLVGRGHGESQVVQALESLGDLTDECLVEKFLLTRRRSLNNDE